MKHRELFLETLDSLRIRNIYTEGFTPEQVFYQIESVASARLESLQAAVCKAHAAFCKRSGSSGDARASLDETVEGLETAEELETAEGAAGEGSLVYESEDEECIKDVAWDDSDTSFDEILNQPADTVLQMLQSKGNEPSAPKK